MNALEVYKILLQRQMNEDRILGERTSLFLLANSFLFLAFVTMLSLNLEGIAFQVLRVLLPLAGILLTFVLYGINRAADNASDFWHFAQYKIEEEAPYFGYMRQNKIAPHINGDDYIKGKKKWERGATGKWELKDTTKLERWLRYPFLWSKHEIRYLPPVFLALWIAALVLVFAT